MPTNTVPLQCPSWNSAQERSLGTENSHRMSFTRDLFSESFLIQSIMSIQDVYGIYFGVVVSRYLKRGPQEVQSVWEFLGLGPFTK